uniref:THAP-type domain-containing protein n=1 Tax=Gouania willdenowi TaxID=441366 RepID=A0A8C5GST9_GOUWI
MPKVYCCVPNCNSSTYHLKKWKQQTCERKMWIKNVGRRDVTHCWKSWTPNKDSRICSKHFKDGSPTKEHPYPTIHMTNVSRPKKGGRIIKRIAIVETKKKITSNRKPANTPQPVGHDAVDSAPVVMEVSSSHQFTTASILDEHNYMFKCDCSSSCTCIGCMVKQREITKLRQKISELENELLAERHKRKLKQSKVQQLLTSNEKRSRRMNEQVEEAKEKEKERQIFCFGFLWCGPAFKPFMM